MTSYRLALGAAALLLSAYTASGQDAKPFLIWAAAEWMHVERDKRVKVAISDQVSDGCWRDPQTSKTAVELEFIRSGFKLDDKAPSTILLTGIGYKTKGVGICVVSYYLTFNVIDVEETYAGGRRLVAITTNKDLYFQGGVMSGGAQDSSDRLKTNFVDFAQATLVHYSKQVQNVKDAIKANADTEGAAFWLNWMNTPKSD